ncbi:MAG TPA: protein translocase subunit SecD, partial [Burkholderiales bacterium]|nr:protein translocase subunit SecD [Burkholderiales bacterium]
MNRFPTWKYALIALAIALAFLYTLPNFFGESPAVQVASGKSTVRMDPSVVGRIEQALQAANIHATGLVLDPTGVRVRFTDTDTQLRAKDAIDRALNPDPKDPAFSVALNLLSASP